MRLELPPEFDPKFYRSRYKDLARFSDSELLDHYRDFGAGEGRAPNKILDRNDFSQILRRALISKESTLEISPFAAPILDPASSLNADVLDYGELIRRAIQEGYEPARVSAPDFVVSPYTGLRDLPSKFEVVVSSHVIEHTPDLIAHLIDIDTILTKGGRYFLFIPDKRHCFDHFLPETTIADVVEAHTSLHKLHSLKSVIEHRALTTHNDASRHWLGDHRDPGYEDSTSARTKAAILEFESSAGGYIDVHSWKFTPEGFRKLLREIRQIYGIELKLREFTLRDLVRMSFGSSWGKARLQLDPDRGKRRTLAPGHRNGLQFRVLNRET